MESLTKDESYARVDQYIQDTTDQMDPHPQLEDMEADVLGPLECEIGGGGTYLTERSYRIRGIPRDRNTEIFNTIHDYWTGNGYRITQDWRDRDKARVLKARNNDDDFSVSLRENIQGGLSISGSSPCVRLSDWPEPTTTLPMRPTTTD